jgi:hypothetical protein
MSASWSTIIGVSLIIYAVYVIYRGRITVSDDYKRSSWVTRAERPVQFRFLVFVVLVFAGLMFFNVFHF